MEVRLTPFSFNKCMQIARLLCLQKHFNHPLCGERRDDIWPSPRRKLFQVVMSTNYRKHFSHKLEERPVITTSP